MSKCIMRLVWAFKISWRLWLTFFEHGMILWISFVNWLYPLRDWYIWTKVQNVIMLSKIEMKNWMNGIRDFLSWVVEIQTTPLSFSHYIYSQTKCYFEDVNACVKVYFIIWFISGIWISENQSNFVEICLFQSEKNYEKRSSNTNISRSFSVSQFWTINYISEDKKIRKIYE